MFYFEVSNYSQNNSVILYEGGQIMLYSIFCEEKFYNLLMKFFKEKYTKRCTASWAITYPKILSERYKIFLYAKSNMIWFYIKYAIFTNVLKILLGKIIIWVKTNNIFEINFEKWSSLCIFQRFVFTFVYRRDRNQWQACEPLLDDKMTQNKRLHTQAGWKEWMKEREG